MPYSARNNIIMFTQDFTVPIIANIETHHPSLRAKYSQLNSKEIAHFFSLLFCCIFSLKNFLHSLQRDKCLIGKMQKKIYAILHVLKEYAVGRDCASLEWPSHKACRHVPYQSIKTLTAAKALLTASTSRHLHVQPPHSPPAPPHTQCALQCTPYWRRCAQEADNYSSSWSCCTSALWATLENQTATPTISVSWMAFIPCYKGLYELVQVSGCV